LSTRKSNATKTMDPNRHHGRGLGFRGHQPGSERRDDIDAGQDSGLQRVHHSEQSAGGLFDGPIARPARIGPEVTPGYMGPGNPRGTSLRNHWPLCRLVSAAYLHGRLRTAVFTRAPGLVWPAAAVRCAGNRSHRDVRRMVASKAASATYL